jgi:hypothetical protein
MQDTTKTIKKTRLEDIGYFLNTNRLFFSSFFFHFSCFYNKTFEFLTVFEAILFYTGHCGLLEFALLVTSRFEAKSIL